ncbi:MAG: hypothetical protein KDA28_07245, partial [Phycisphaerales bacterium]|nr:hypothetical protein [Phycisphaerales bacterium]
VFVGVHDSNSGWDSASKVVKERGITYPVALDKGGVSVQNYALQFWPTYVVIDRTGVVRAAGLTPDRVEDVVKVLLAEAAPAPTVMAAEFGPEVYYGGARRPKAFREAEGRVLGAVRPEAWLGTEVPAASFDRSVRVFTLVSPSLTRSVEELGALMPVVKDMARQGVVFTGVCPSNVSDEAWVRLGTRRADGAPSIPIWRDAPGEAPEALGAMSESLGITLFPCTVVVDRAGVVRAAGVRADQVRPMLEKLIAEPVPPADGPPS